MRIITLTTDFGSEDWFVGTMKGVILNLNPRATVVDITHGIAPGDIRAGAFALASAYRYFPRHTIHLAVVDPGVGSDRAAIAVRTADHLFIGPDNGILSLALSQESIRSIQLLEHDRYFLSRVSRTFHGRDVFAPVAAHVSKGVAVERLGRKLADYQRLDLPEPLANDTRLTGEVVYIDRFGNAITNISAKLLSSSIQWVARIEGKVRRPALIPFVDFYDAVAKGQPLALIGSTGLLEIAVNRGDAAKRLRLKVGDSVTLRRGPA